MEVDMIIKIVSWCLTGLSVIITFIVGLRKGKYKGLFKSISVVKANIDKIIELVEEAEKHENYSSADKLEFVLTRYQAYCIEKNLDFNQDEVVEEVEELIRLSKEVNSKNKSLKY